MKRKHLIIIAIGVVVWLAETWAFGWNAKPGSVAEARWDGFGIVIILWGVIGDVLSGVRITKNYHNVTTNRINTKTVQFEKGQKVTTKQTINVHSGVKPGTNKLEFKQPNA